MMRRDVMIGQFQCMLATVATRRRGLHALLLAALLLAWSGRTPAVDTDPHPRGSIEIAIAPFLPTRTLVSNYQPLRAYLEKALREPVTIVTAPDYPTYFERIARREYPVIVTVAHSAWLAQADSGYVPMLRPAELTQPTLVVARQGRHQRVADLRGATIALPDPLAVVSAQALGMLRQHGFDPGRDVTLRHFPTHSAAVNHVLSGEVAAAIVSDRALQQMPAESQDGVRILTSWKPGAAPGVVYLANPALSRERIEQLTGALLSFATQTKEGIALMRQWGYGGLVRTSAEELAPLAPYGRWLRTEIPRATGDPAPDAATR